MQESLYNDAFTHSRILFSNGWVVKQCFDGFMKSCIYNTISDNSVAMVAMHILACLRSGQKLGKFAAIGDDVMQSIISDQYLDEIQRAGCRVKEVINHIEFMGADYQQGYPEHMYFQKHLINICCKPGIEEEVLDSYLRLYAYSGKFDFWKRLADNLGVKTRTPAYYKFWYSSPLAKVMNSLW